jgi:hypothetical protein
MRAWALVYLLGCGARSELDVPALVDAAASHDAHHTIVDAGLDVVDEPIPFVAVCDVPEAARPDEVCTLGLAMGSINQPGACINDYAIDGGEVGQLEYACDGGSSWAAATFHGQTFPGSIHGHDVDVCIGTTFPFQDGPACGLTKSVWSTAQRIFGDETSGMLTYTYVDKLISGHSCWSPCYAWAPVTVGQ